MSAIILSRKRATKALIRQCGCEAWSVPLLFACNGQFSRGEEIISINNSNFQIFSKRNFLHFKSFENLWKMKHLLLRSKCAIFHNILKYLTFQRRPKALVRS